MQSFVLVDVLVGQGKGNMVSPWPPRPTKMLFLLSGARTPWGQTAAALVTSLTRPIRLSMKATTELWARLRASLSSLSENIFHFLIGFVLYLVYMPQIIFVEDQ